MAFYTIHPAPDLGPAARRRAGSSGPPAVASPRATEHLLASAGFRNIAAADVTEAYRTTQQDWFDQWKANAEDVREAIGAALFEERQQERRTTLAAIDEGLLRRTLFVAARPRRHRH